MNLVEYNQKAYNLTLQFPWLPPVSGFEAPLSAKLMPGPNQLNSICMVPFLVTRVSLDINLWV